MDVVRAYFNQEQENQQPRSQGLFSGLGEKTLGTRLENRQW